MPARSSSVELVADRGSAGPGSASSGPSTQPGHRDRGGQVVAARRRACRASRCPAWRGSSGRSLPGGARTRGRAAGSRTATRPARSSVSPMPIRMPVVNGTPTRPASSSTRSRTAGSLSGRAVVRPARLGPQPGGRGLQHHAHARRDRLEPLQLRPGQHARVEVRQQPGLLQHRDRAGPHVVQRGVVAARVQPLPGRRPALLRPVAEGEQRLLAALRRRPARAIASTSSRSRNAAGSRCGTVANVQ